VEVAAVSITAFQYSVSDRWIMYCEWFLNCLAVQITLCCHFLH